MRQAIELYRVEVAWRKRAAGELAAGLNSYDDAIKTSIGVRLQERLARRTSPEASPSAARTTATSR